MATLKMTLCSMATLLACGSCASKEMNVTNASATKPSSSNSSTPDPSCTPGKCIELKFGIANGTGQPIVDKLTGLKTSNTALLTVTGTVNSPMTITYAADLPSNNTVPADRVGIAILNAPSFLTDSSSSSAASGSAYSSTGSGNISSTSSTATSTSSSRGRKTFTGTPVSAASGVFRVIARDITRCKVLGPTSSGSNSVSSADCENTAVSLPGDLTVDINYNIQDNGSSSYATTGSTATTTSSYTTGTTGDLTSSTGSTSGSTSGSDSSCGIIRMIIGACGT